MIHADGGVHVYGFWADKRPNEGRLTILTNTETGLLDIIDGPDPRILIADEVLWNLAHDPEGHHPLVSLEWQPLCPCPAETCCQSCPQGPSAGQRECFYGSKLTIDTSSRKLIYIVGEYHCEQNAWWAHWPD